MPKKIDDILNPKSEPNLVKEQLLSILTEAGQEGLAMTKRELFQAARFNWLDVAPIGEGGLFITLAASIIDAELGVSKVMDELREAALAELLAEHRVLERESEGQAYYWKGGASGPTGALGPA